MRDYFWMIDLNKKYIFKTQRIGETSTTEIYLDKDGISEIILECDECGTTSSKRYRIFSYIKDILPYYSGALGIEVEATEEEIITIQDIMSETYKTNPEHFI